MVSSSDAQIQLFGFQASDKLTSVMTGFFRQQTLVRPTSVRGVESGEGDDKEGGRIFPSIHQVREGSLGVTVTPQALTEAEPGGQTLDDGAQAV